MMNSGSLPPLQNKLHPPPLPTDFLPRPHLIEGLNRALVQPVTLISAPAGYGKTTLASSWFQASTAPSCWLNLEEDDNSLQSFLYYLLTAIQGRFPSACPTTQLLLQLPESPPFAFVKASLINELAELPESIILVLDNFHLMQEPQVVGLVSALIQNQPATVRLLILARGEPHLPLVRLRARNEIREIGVAELTFTPDEVQAYLNLIGGKKLAPATAGQLVERTEGWIMGLHLTVRDLRERQATAQDELSSEATGRNLLADYFERQILAGQPPDVLRFLMSVAILDSFCSSLCRELLAEEEVTANGQILLEHVRRSGFFLLPDDERRGWYRFLGLFRETLQQLADKELDRATIAALHNRASVWLADNGYVEEAVGHALAADHPEAAARIVEKHAQGALQREEIALLGHWLRLLPPDLIKQRPGLLVAQAWQQHLSAHRAPIEPLLVEAERLLEQREGGEHIAETDSSPGEIAALRSSYNYWNGQTHRAERFARMALAQLPVDHPASYHALCFLALAEQAIGNTSKAAGRLERASHSFLASTSASLSPILLAQAHLTLYDARLDGLATAANILLKYGSERQLPATTEWGHYFLGRLFYEWNRLQDAAVHFSTLAAGDPPFSLDAYGDSLLGLALVHRASGDVEASVEAISTLEALGTPHTIQAAAFKAWLAVEQGEMEAAIDWLETTTVPEAAAYLFAIESPLLMRIRVLIAQRTPESLRKAIHLLSPALRAAQTAHNKLYVVKVLALRALALQAQGQLETALDVLARAITMVAEGSMVRTFVDLGPPMVDLLYELVRKRYRASTHAEQILAAFVTTSDTVHPLALAANESLIEPLTQRELEILQMLYQRLSNIEIADALGISPLTVKKHTINVYQKLNVRSRQDAVRTGSQLGLIVDVG